jgi:hypothetical protein
MKSVILALLCFSFNFAYAHNMGNLVKKSKRIDSLSKFDHKVRPHDIQMEFSEYNLNPRSLIERIENTADLDIDEFNVKVHQAQKSYLVNCDIVSGEYLFMGQSARYFILYKNCTKTDLKTHKETKISFSPQIWDDWKYSARSLP